MTDTAFSRLLAGDRLRLTREEIHIWCFELDTVDVDPREDLSEDEIATAGRFHQKIDQIRFMACRGVLRRLLSRYIGKNPQKIAFKYGANGKPELAESEAVNVLRFNVSHSKGLGLIGITLRREIGVDIERMQPMADLELMAQSCFSEREKRGWDALPEVAKGPAFYEAWTKKEAALKACGKGLSEEVENAVVHENGRVSVAGKEMVCFFGFFPHLGYRAAVATLAAEPEKAPSSREKNGANEENGLAECRG